MSSTARNPKALLRRTRRTSLTRRSQDRLCRPPRSFGNGGRTCSKVSDKLEALKNLIPTHSGETVKPDQLFEETADYIVHLRTQVVILQRLIEFYGSSGRNNVVL